MISLCTRLFSADGHFILQFLESSDLDTVARRVTKYPTTDGGCEFFDGGWTDADRTLRVKTDNIVDALRIQELSKIHQKWTVSWRDQFSLVHIESVTISGGEATIDLMGDL